MYHTELDYGAFNQFRNDRQHRKKSLLDAVKTNKMWKKININSINGIEQLFLKLSLSNNN